MVAGNNVFAIGFNSLSVYLLDKLVTVKALKDVNDPFSHPLPLLMGFRSLKSLGPS